MHGGGYIAPGSLSGVTPHIERAGSRLSGLSPKVLLDVEVANMAQNAVNYQILARGLSRYYSIMSSAVSDGKK
jgi:flagellar basal-body rod protein FlgB